TNWKVPALSFGSMATLGFTAAIAAFVSSAGAMAAGPIADYVRSRRSARRKHAISYLVGLGDLGSLARVTRFPRCEPLCPRIVCTMCGLFGADVRPGRPAWSLGARHTGG